MKRTSTSSEKVSVPKAAPKKLAVLPAVPENSPSPRSAAPKKAAGRPLVSKPKSAPAQPTLLEMEPAPQTAVNKAKTTPATPATPAKAAAGTAEPVNGKVAGKVKETAKSPREAERKKPAATKPAVAKSVATKPAATKPAVAKFVATKSAVAKPAAAKPVIAKPTVTKPAVTKPAVTKPKPIATQSILEKPSPVSRAKRDSGKKPTPRTSSALELFVCRSGPRRGKPQLEAAFRTRSEAVAFLANVHGLASDEAKALSREGKLRLDLRRHGSETCMIRPTKMPPPDAARALCGDLYL